jgi:hypothetical protein
MGGEGGGAGPLSPEACRRLACDGAVTRVVVTRHHPPDHDHPGHDHPGGERDLAARLQAAAALLPPILGGAPGQPLDLGRSSRVITPPSAPPWPSATAAVSSPTASDPWPGARAIIWCTGWTAAPPTSPTWPWSAGPTTERSTRRAAGADPRPRRPADRDPTGSTTPTTPATSHRRLSRPWILPTKPGECTGPNAPTPCARQLYGTRTSPTHRASAPCAGTPNHLPDPPCQVGDWGPNVPGRPATPSAACGGPRRCCAGSRDRRGSS